MGSLAATERCTILLFYHYVRPAAMSFQRTEQLKDFLEKVTTEVTIGGRIRCVARPPRPPRGADGTIVVERCSWSRSATATVSSSLCHGAI